MKTATAFVTGLPTPKRHRLCVAVLVATRFAAAGRLAGRDAHPSEADR